MNILVQILALILGVFIVINFKEFCLFYFEIRELYHKFKFNLNLNKSSKKIIKQFKKEESDIINKWCQSVRKQGLKLTFKIEYIFIKNILDVYFENEIKRFKDNTELYNEIIDFKPSLTEDQFKKIYDSVDVITINSPEDLRNLQV